MINSIPFAIHQVIPCKVKLSNPQNTSPQDVIYTKTYPQKPSNMANLKHYPPHLPKRHWVQPSSIVFDDIRNLSQYSVPLWGFNPSFTNFSDILNYPEFALVFKISTLEHKEIHNPVSGQKG